MVFIYALMSGQLVLYVGQTINKHIRERVHRNGKDTSSSKYIPEYTDWIMVVLEECDKSSARIKEQYYYDTLKPLYNRCRPGQTQREVRHNWYIANKEKAKEQSRRYREANREKHAEAQRRYIAKKKAESISPV